MNKFHNIVNSIKDVKYIDGLSDYREDVNVLYKRKLVELMLNEFINQ